MEIEETQPGRFKIDTTMYIGDWYGSDWGDLNGGKNYEEIYSKLMNQFTDLGKTLMAQNLAIAAMSGRLNEMIGHKKGNMSCLNAFFWLQYHIFSFFRHRESLENKGITVNFLENKSISFIIKKENNQTFLSSDFETLTVNTVQNFLDYAEKDESKKETENYTYILYNKDNQEKMKLKYHDKGAWFEVEIL